MCVCTALLFCFSLRGREKDRQTEREGGRQTDRQRERERKRERDPGAEEAPHFASKGRHTHHPVAQQQQRLQCAFVYEHLVRIWYRV